jgi:Flp pilus assembly protein CpaB
MVAAAMLAGVTVSLLAAEGPDQPVPPDSRFGTSVLVTGLEAVPVRFADPGSAAFLRPGDRVDVLAAEDPSDPFARPSRSVSGGRSGPDPAGAARVAEDVSVLEISGSTDGSAGGPALARGAGGDPGLVFLAVDNATAERLAGASARARLSYALRSPAGH